MVSRGLFRGWIGLKILLFQQGAGDSEEQAEKDFGRRIAVPSPCRGLLLWWRLDITSTQQFLQGSPGEP